MNDYLDRLIQCNEVIYDWDIVFIYFFDLFQLLYLIFKIKIKIRRFLNDVFLQKIELIVNIYLEKYLL